MSSKIDNAEKNCGTWLLMSCVKSFVRACGCSAHLVHSGSSYSVSSPFNFVHRYSLLYTDRKHFFVEREGAGLHCIGFSYASICFLRIKIDSSRPAKNFVFDKHNAVVVQVLTSDTRKQHPQCSRSCHVSSSLEDGTNAIAYIQFPQDHDCFS